MICFDELCLSYALPDGGDRTVLAGIDLSLDAGQFVCLLGPSGCGKTSLLNLVAGFVRPTRGRVRFQGKPVSRPSPERGVVFQEPTLFPWLTVRQNIEFGLRCADCPAEQRDQRVARAVATVRMQGHEDVYPHALSGGMKQRVAIARVLVMEPRALLMDEPFSALDANAREHLQDELLRIWQQHRCTVLYVTHSVEEAAYLADRVLIMGPPPNSVRIDLPLTLPRPRRRLSPEMQELTQELRAWLDRLPCCVAPGSLLSL